jgi:serine phosphatase RsbU (regulator of sigma subunit)
MIDEATYDDETLTLQPGDRLYCYTDGTVEAVNAAEEEFGLDRLIAAIERWRGLPLRAGLDRIAADVRAWSGGPLKDDISLIAIERTG